MAKRQKNTIMIPVISGRKKVTLYLLLAVWMVSLFIFIAWWSFPSYIIGWTKFAINTAMLLWINVLPGYFFYFALRMKIVDPLIVIPEGWKVAMITTRAPSEPVDVVQNTLSEMLRQEYPHDTWLADEDPTEELKIWCRQNNVFLSTRKGIQEYHRDSWPRRTKCKEGNLAYFYDHYGYEKYDFVVQMDADHIPGENYLQEMLRPFVDPAVGYVSAPSICDTNANESWTARRRLFSEAIMHGPLQAGYSNGYASLCIGSHYAVRTRALNEIGGLGPELAEDHSTTLMMNGHGWKGIHALNAIANGEGPPTLEACITQEFQWSRSLMVLLLTELPKYWKKLPLKLRFQFLFSELWYPLFGLMFLVGTLLPVIAVLSDEAWISVSFIEFILYSTPVNISTLAVVWFLKKNSWLRPHYAPVISWESVLFLLFRWPWAIYGSFMGILLVLSKKKTEFKVTPKGRRQNATLSWTILYPYLLIILVSALPGILVRDSTNAAGYHFFLIFNVVLYVAVIISILILDINENKRQSRINI